MVVWYELQIEPCQPEDVPELEAALTEAGALSLTLTDKYDNPIFEPELGTTPLWQDVVLKALFTAEDQAKICINQLKAIFSTYQYHIVLVEDQDWERVSLDSFHPQQYGEHLWVCPSWISPPDPKAINVIVDPGLAFGTGSHETTTLCLQWLEKNNIRQQHIIDYGCGSGILALSALKLGAALAQATDIDEQALLAARNNAAHNQIAPEQLMTVFPEQLKAGCDILLANILLAPLLSLKQSFYDLLKPQGTLVISGILSEQIAQIVSAYQDLFVQQEYKIKGDWALVVFKKLIVNPP